MEDFYFSEAENTCQRLEGYLNAVSGIWGRLSVPCWKMESEGLCFLKKCHRANAGKLRQTSKSSGWWAWMGQWNLGLLYCSWNEGMKFMFGDFNYFQTTTSWITSVNHGVTSPEWNIHHRRGCCSEKPAYCDQRVAFIWCNWRGPCAATKTQHNQK